MIVSETANRTLSRKLMARVLSCVIVVVPVGLAAADEQSGVKGDPEGWEQVDANGDGFIDLNEAKVMADWGTSQQAASVRPITGEQILAFMDTNRDRKISKDEWAAMVAFQTKSQQAGTAERKAAEKIVRSMDANRDGKISKDEISAVMKPYFEQIDTNGDGFIDAKEAWGMAYTASSQQLQGRVTAEQIVSYFQYLDANGDGLIDLKEAQVMADYATSQQAASVKPITGEQILAFMDTNRDGKISKDELVAMAAFQTKSQQAGTAERKAAEKIVRSMDANRDGKISKDEISTVLKPYFEQIDTNGDGFIDAKEAWGMAYSASSR